MSENIFDKLLAINVSAHLEKKAGFSYLSWPYAVAELRKADPAATWEVKHFNGVPFMETSCGYFVEVSVTVAGIALTQVHPVLDNANRPVGKPNAFQINTSIMRCLVKAIALHGLGLYIYAGEDLPGELTDGPSGETPTAKPAATAPSPDHDRVKTALHTLYGADKTSALDTVEAMTAFKGKDGPVPGVRDFTRLTGKRLEILADKLERMAADKRAQPPQEPAICSECRKPVAANGACYTEGCSLADNIPF